MADEGAQPADTRRADRPLVPPALDRMAAWSWRVIVVGVALVVVVWILARLRLVVLPVILALLITSVLHPPVRFLKARRWPPALATWTVLLVVIGGFVGLGFAVAPTVADEFADLGPTLEEAVETIEDWLINGPLHLTSEQIEEYQEEFFDRLRENTEAIVSGVIAGVLLAGEVIAGAIIAVVIAFFFLKDGERMQLWILDQLDEEHRVTLRALAERGWRTISGYIRGAATVATVDAVGIGLGLWIIGVPLVLPIAVLTFFGGFFPIVGATVAGVIAVLVALVTVGVTEAILTAIVVIAVQQLESNFLQPVVMGRAVRLHPVVVLSALTAGAVIGGLVGAFLSVPVAAVAAAVIGEYRALRDAGAAGLAPPPGPAPAGPAGGPGAAPPDG